jgi:hypothetical protein
MTVHVKPISMEPFTPPPRCDTHRKYTSAHCERAPDHVDVHTGRDGLGRWHMWTDPT